MQAPKNGFFYVIDRQSGKLISAQPFAKVNWASSIDLATGRPVEAAGIRYEHGPVTMWPGGEGAHNWLPMSMDPKTGLVYMAIYDLPFRYDDHGIDLEHWVRTPGNAEDNGVNVDLDLDIPGSGTASLIAWNPVTQKRVWRVPMSSFWNGGTMATAGNLVFHGRADGFFDAYAADTGTRLWSFEAGTAVLAPPITFRAGGQQYVTVLSGFGGSGALFGKRVASLGWQAQTQPRRVLTFNLGGNAVLPPRLAGVSQRQ
jgi:quinohemoprotein ethanol dehydrogenase